MQGAWSLYISCIFLVNFLCFLTYFTHLQLEISQLCVPCPHAPHLGSLTKSRADGLLAAIRIVLFPHVATLRWNLYLSHRGIYSVLALCTAKDAGGVCRCKSPFKMHSARTLSNPEHTSRASMASVPNVFDVSFELLQAF